MLFGLDKSSIKATIHYYNNYMFQHLKHCLYFGPECIVNIVPSVTQRPSIILFINIIFF